MKIGYFADGPWSHEALELITRDNNLEIAFIIPRYETQDPVLKEWARKLDIDFIPIRNVNSNESIEKISKYEADILVSMSFNQIIKKPLIGLTKNGFINCHAGKLPFYRGCNVLNWVLINGEDHFGVTVHYIDEGIDTGDILSQEISVINDYDDYGSILKRATSICAKLLYESLIKIKNSNINPIKQTSIDPKGSYCRRRIDGDEMINWSWTSIEIFNFIRAITKPGPYARSIINSKLLLFHNSELLKDIMLHDEEPGVILDNTDGLIVKTGDTAIKIKNYSFENQSKHNKNDLGIGKKFIW